MIDGLDLVEEEDQITHLLSLMDEFEGQDQLSMSVNYSVCLCV